MDHSAELGDYVDGGLGIAIIGMAGRFPGAGDIDAFWDILCAGAETIHFFSDEELRDAGVPQADLEDPNYVKAAAMLEDIEFFDASFFGYTPLEASFMDPQQRILLECAWQALEHAGYAGVEGPRPEADRRRSGVEGAGAVGVFAGIKVNTYIGNLLPSYDAMEPEDRMQVLMGNAEFALATRISYKLNLKGPSYMLQTACSTSLAAVHLACQALLFDECRVALAGAVGVEIPHRVGYFYQYGGPASPDGHCRPFDAQAQGTVFGSGVGMVVLKRLDDALADGDQIYAVIRGTAVNNDGAVKASFTAPSVEGQTEVILEALACSGVDVDTISYVEAHGTGTPLGDPIEIMALKNAFRAGTDKKGFCRIGSVKGNFGHLDAAAGIAGFFKTVLALKHGQIPPSLHFERPNPEIDLANSPFVVNTELTEWPTDGTPRRAGVSSFGFGGTNTHVILQEAPPAEPSGASRPAQLLVLSAKTSSALEAATANLTAHLKDNSDLNLADVAFTLQVGRQAFRHRRVLVCQDLEDALQALEAAPVRALTALQESSDRPIVFMFPGQGAQYVNMGLELYQTEPLFREQVDRCVDFLLPHLGFDLRTVLYPAPSEEESATQKLTQTAVTQPALFVIEYALAQLWMSWGIVPQAMIGHSIGEYVAACLAGVLSLEDALALVAVRGRLMQQMPEGAMLSVALPVNEVMTLLNERLSLAASNGPALCVVSGPTDAVDALQERLAAQDIPCRRLHTSHAFHSEMMAPMLEPFAGQIKKVSLRAPQIPYLSNVSGTWITDAEAIDPRYWARHVRQAVRFAEGVGELLQSPDRILLEVGPGRTLSTLARQHQDVDVEVTAFSSMRHPRQQGSDVAFLLTMLGRLWLAGERVDWAGFYAHERRRRLPLPTYPFERQRYWVDAPQQAGGERPFQGTVRKKTDVADWFYLPIWKQSMPPLPFAAGEFALKSRWLLFVDDVGLGSQLAGRLGQAGQDVVTVAVGQQFAKLGENAYAIAPQQRDDYDALFEALHDSDRAPDKIVHLWQVMSPVETPSRLEFGEHCQRRGFYSLLFLAQALTARGGGETLQIGVVSNNMQAVIGPDGLYPEKATVVGLCKVIPQEYPHLSCRCIDVSLSEASTPEEKRVVDQLLAELGGHSSDQVVAYRGLHRWVQDFDKLQLDSASGGLQRLRQGGVYLITGGLGGIGLVMATHLAQTVQAKLVLTKRSAFPERDEWEQWLIAHDGQDDVSDKIRKLQDLESMGAEVMVAVADVADPGQMRSVVARARERFGVIHGVIHAAGVAGGGIIQLKTPENAAAVLSPKVKGALVLADLFANSSLDFTVLFSSLSAILGEFGQADYCAANAFLDALARHNTLARDQLTLSINWDVWGEVGMTVQTDVPEILQTWREEQFKLAISSSEGVAVFDRILSQSTWPQVAVCTTDLDTMVDRLGALTQEEILERVEQLPAPAFAQPRPDLQTPYVAPRDERERVIADIWQRALGIDQIGIHDNFFEVGGHSLLAIRIIGRMQDAFKIEFPIEKLFDAPTVADLAGLVGEMQTDQEDQDALEILAMLSEMSEEELDAGLAELLDPSEPLVQDDVSLQSPMTQAPRQLDYYTIVPHPADPRLLMLSENDSWSLPHVVPGQHHFGAVADIGQSLHNQLGLTATVLRCVDYDYHAVSQSVQAVYATENHNPGWSPPPAGRWVGRVELQDLALALPEQRSLLEAWFDETENGRTPERRRSWAQTGWFDAASEWINAQLDHLGLAASGPIEQLRVWGVSCVLRVDTAAGPFYFRAVPEKSAHEPLLLQALSQQYPTHLPEVLAIDAARHWVLMREVRGQPLLQVSDLKRWEAAVRTLAQMQVDLAAQTERLLSWGCPDRRLDALAIQIDPLLADTAALQRGRFGGLAEDEIGRLRALAPELKRMCAQLADYGVPPSLEHGDFHPGNVYATADSHVYFDWGESSLAFPFFSMSSLEYHLEYVLPDMRDARTRLLDVYLEPWTIYAPRARLAEAFEFARPLAALHAALTFYRLISSLEDAAQWEMEIESALPFSLKMLLRYMDHDGG